MDVSKYFFNILKSIDYHIGHLPRDLFANEEQLPELLPIFTWFINNVTPASNCVTPKELTLFASISSKHENYSSLEKVSKAINSFYDENTKNSKVCSLDLETLERNISKSQQELNDLKSHGTLYEKKIQLVDDEISLLKQQENSFITSCNETENNLYSILKKFTEQVDSLGLSINKLHNQVISSMKDDNVCLTKLASINLVNLSDAWRQQIFKMINVWFKEEGIKFVTNNVCSKKVHALSLLSQSVSELRKAEIFEKCEIAKLKVAVTNIFNMKNNFINMENLVLSELDMTKYIANFLKHQDILVSSYEQSTSIEYENLQSRLSDIVVANAKSKLLELEIINNHITFIQDSIEHYIMINDVLWCLMRTACSMANFKCELVLHCINFLENTLYDIDNILQWTSNNLEICAQKQNTGLTSTLISGEIVNFNGYKHYSSIYTNIDEIEKLSEMVQLWKSKYHYSRDECNKLTILQQKLLIYNDTVNGLISKYSNMT